MPMGRSKRPSRKYGRKLSGAQRSTQFCGEASATGTDGRGGVSVALFMIPRGVVRPDSSLDGSRVNGNREMGDPEHLRGE